MTAGPPVYYSRVRQSLFDRVRIFSKGWTSRRVGFTRYERLLCEKRRLAQVPTYHSLPGTQYEGTQFRRSLLDTIPVIGEEPPSEIGPAPGLPLPFSPLVCYLPVALPHLDKLAHQVIPRHPELRPHARMLHHFRFILPLLQKDQDGLTPLHYYDSGIQLARNSSEEPTEAEYVRSMDAAHEIKRM